MKAQPNRQPAGMDRPGPGRREAVAADRRYLGRRWIYTQVSGRTGGLSVGVNLTPGHQCDYRCRYCDVPKAVSPQPDAVDGLALARELEETLESIRTGEIFSHPAYRRLPVELRTLGQVMLSGEGEPTLCPNFLEVVEALVHARARGRHPFFRFVLETNGSGLARPGVLEGLGHFTSQDEVWVKLDAGTAERFRSINGVELPFEQVLSRIRSFGRLRPVVIHSLFASLEGCPPTRSEIGAYLRCLNDLRSEGAGISRVQIYSVGDAPLDSGCSLLPLGSLSEIARQVRLEVGVEADVF